MSQFIYSEAEESEEEQEEYEENERKKLKKLKTVKDDSSEEDDDDDEEKIREENKDFINDDDEEDDEGDSGSDSEKYGKRKRRKDDEDKTNYLDDDDIDLIEENTGMKLDRKRKYKRLKRIVDEESDVEEKDVQGQIRREIFEGSDRPRLLRQGKRSLQQDEEEDGASALHPPQHPEMYASEEEESDEENFIVDDKTPNVKQERMAMLEPGGMEVAREIFGGDYHFEDFQQHEEWEDRENDDDGHENDEKGDEGREHPRGRKDRGNQVKKTIFERFQLRRIPVTRTRGDGDDRSADKELTQEAKWIYHHAFFRPFISNQEGREKARHGSHKDTNTIQKIYNALDLMMNQTFEIPFIAFYRKEEVCPELNIRDLWKIYRWDEKWCQLKYRKENLRSLFQSMREYQGDHITKDPDGSHLENMRILQEEDIVR
ncbi:transcription elongation factor SPT6-like [Procambarus clarkii]|uniref:transcription elongation factor SPT6-like n=1 Tax=Procambarus clarkii TaxID=6728 RepID=UPI00374472FA